MPVTFGLPPIHTAEDTMRESGALLLTVSDGEVTPDSVILKEMDG